MAKVVCIEGPDRVGKNSQSKALCDYLRFDGKKAVLVEVPIRDGHTYKIIYWMLQNGLAKSLPRVFQWIQCLNRLVFQTFKLTQLEHDNDYIVFDRWSLSSVVYGQAEGISKQFCENLYRKLRKPDYTIVLLGKSHSHEAEDAYERDDCLQARVRELYADWSVANPYKSRVVDCTKARERVTMEIVTTLKTAGIISK